MTSKILLETLEHKKGSSTPVWFMRQAGRFLPEYREIRSKASFDDLLNNPALAAEVTLQPINRFKDIDAAIIFSDILIVLNALGCQVRFDQGKPYVQKTLDQLNPLDPVRDEYFFPVQEALKITRRLAPDHVATIGFSGAPWTLMAYGLGGASSNQWARSKKFLKEQPLLAHQWLNKIAMTVGQLLNLQVNAGAEVVQLFDSWAGDLTEEEFMEWGFPYAAQVMNQVSAPKIYFPRRQNIPIQIQTLSCQGLSISWESDLLATCKQFPNFVIQGNLNPSILLDGVKPTENETLKILNLMKDVPHIFNLGHGVLPETPIASVEACLRVIKHGK